MRNRYELVGPVFAKHCMGYCIVGYILPGCLDSKLLISKQPGDQRLLVPSEGLGNEDKVPCQRALLPLPADSNRGPHDWESVVLSTEPQQLKHCFLLLNWKVLKTFMVFLSCKKWPTEEISWGSGVLANLLNHISKDNTVGFSKLLTTGTMWELIPVIISLGSIQCFCKITNYHKVRYLKTLETLSVIKIKTKTPLLNKHLDVKHAPMYS